MLGRDHIQPPVFDIDEAGINSAIEEFSYTGEMNFAPLVSRNFWVAFQMPLNFGQFNLTFK